MTETSGFYLFTHIAKEIPQRKIVRESLNPFRDMYRTGPKTFAEAKMFIVTSNCCSYINKGCICVRFRDLLLRIRTGGGVRDSFVAASNSFTAFNSSLIS
jgi:hypothetical protein